MIVLDLGWALNPVTGVLIRNRKGTDTESHRKEGHVKTEAETRMTWLQVKEHQRSPAATRS